MRLRQKTEPDELDPAQFPGEGSQTTNVPAVIAGFSGWLLDAFDFFMLTFCLTAIVHDFRMTDAQIALVIWVTLLFRPVGGFVFGLMGDRFGRRVPLMINVAVFAIAEILTGLAPNYLMLLVVRGLFGVVMGGNWGLGTSLAMEGAAKRHRGVLSGLLQEGYAAGSVLAALCFFLFYNKVGWRPLFFIGCVPAIGLVFFLQFVVTESAVWKKAAGAGLRGKAQWDEIFSHSKLFFYLLAFLTMMVFAAHGTQDMYPTFLQRERHFTATHSAAISALAGIGALSGGLLFGYFSDRWGRRRAIITALCLGVLVIPLWVYSHNQYMLVLGAMLMQFMVQGAWGVIPAYLSELSPTSVRALLPGFAYQSASVIAGSAPFIEATYAPKIGYSAALALTAVCVFVLASMMAWVGKEKHGVELDS